ncbi:MAG: hypothetical protein ACTIA5_01290 [Brachybacterium tyrofermentans]|uniref:hypothetical protein n=1 Tax=Brachybacterium tyrofermentans TaxID=47848 RepID=UPI003FB74AE3
MNSSRFPSYDEVARDLGDNFLMSVVEAVDGARDDYVDFKLERSDWFATFTQRFVANFIHERIWARLVPAIDGDDAIVIEDREPVRQIRVGHQYTIRLKRHHEGDRISAFATPSNEQFWMNELAVALEGLEAHTLAVGYRWDADLHEIREPVLSFRESKEKPVWSYELSMDAVEAPRVIARPLEGPFLPQPDLSSILEERREDEAR